MLLSSPGAGASTPAAQLAALRVVHFVLVFAGGAVGTGLRHVMGLACDGLGPEWLATWSVNVLGAFAMGALAVRWSGGGREVQRLFLGVGLLGGFTTYSTFNAELLALAARGEHASAVGYAALTLLVGLGAGALGHFAGRAR